MNAPSTRLALISLLLFVPAAGEAETTIEGVVPPPSTTLPANAQIWLLASSSEGPPLELTFTMASGAVHTVTTDEGRCCFSYRVATPPLEPGEVTVTVTPPDGEAATFTYVVSDELDEEPPLIGAPAMTVTRFGNRGATALVRGFGGHRVSVPVPEVSDDWGIAAVLPAFNSERPFPVLNGELNPVPRWEDETPMVGDEQLSEGATALFQGHQSEGCVRMTVVDFAGHGVTSETTCISFEAPSENEGQSAGLAELFALFCSCTALPPARLGAEAGLLGLGAIGLLLCRRRRAA